MKSRQPKIGNTLWGVWEHRYYNEKRLVELEYVVYPVKITRFFRGKYVDAHCVGVDVDGHTAVHWVAVKSIGKSVFYNPTDAAKYAEAISDYYDKHYAFCRSAPLKQKPRNLTIQTKAIPRRNYPSEWLVSAVAI